MLRSCGRLIALAVVASFASLALLASTHAQPIVSGYNPSGGTGPTIPVPFPPGGHEWILEGSLIFDPTAPPMTKVFGTPTGTSGAPIPIDALQPFPILVHEYFNLFPLPGNSRHSGGGLARTDPDAGLDLGASRRPSLPRAVPAGHHAYHA